MLLKDIHENKVHVDRIINQFIQAGDDLKSRESAIKRLAQENLLSELQFLEIQENIDKMDVKKLIKIIKQSKIGQGVQFLPRLNSDLVHSLTDLLKTIASNKSTADIEKVVKAILNELLHRNIITKGGYKKIKLFIDPL